MASTTLSTTLVNGDPTAFPALQNIPELPVAAHTPALVRRATVISDRASPMWAGIRSTVRHSLRRPLRVTVLGSSSTNGCGSGEPTYSARCYTNDSAPKALTKQCFQARSWVRHLHDALTPRLHGLSLAVHARNAMGPEYFARCSSRFVGAKDDVIVLELATVGDMTEELPMLLESLRRVAMNAAVVLLMWTPQTILFGQTPPGEVNATGRLERTAVAHGVDVVRIDRIALATLTHPELSHGRASQPERGESVGRGVHACGPRVAKVGVDYAWPAARSSTTNQSNAAAFERGPLEAAVARAASPPPRLPHGLPFVSLHRPQAVVPAWLYAQRGKDIVHPSPEGHVLLGRVVAQYISTRLGLDHMSAHAGNTSATPMPGRREYRALGSSEGTQVPHRARAAATPGGTPIPASTASIASAPAQPSTALQAPAPLNWEQCYTAETFPISKGAPPWRLVDEGGEKGVKKIGLLSTSVGDSVLFGPLGSDYAQRELAHLRQNWMGAPTHHGRLRAPSIARGTTTSGGDGVRGTTGAESELRLAVEVGYLLAPRSDFGALYLSCENCTCRREKSTFAKSLHPFPRVDTDARFNPNPHYHAQGFNASITTSTMFMMALPFTSTTPMQALQECMLRVTHAPASSGLSVWKARGCPVTQQAWAQSRNRTGNLACQVRTPSRVRLDWMAVWKLG